MKFCPSCESVMRQSMATGRVVFHCEVCSTEVEGQASDTLIFSGVIETGIESEEQKYARLLVNAAHDPSNEKVHRTCPKCGLDYMTQIRVGSRELIIFKCKCGHEER